MTIKLINQESGKEIGQINLDYIPPKDEHIEFENQTYGISKIIHSESAVKLIIFNLPDGWNGEVNIF